MNQGSALLTVKQVALELGVRPKTIYDWTNRGLIAHVRIQSGLRRAVIRYRQKDLDRFIEVRIVAPRMGVRRGRG